MDELRNYFKQRLRELEERNPEDSKLLQGDLLEWGAAVVAIGTLYNAIEANIRYMAREREISPERFVDILFSQPNHDLWMLAFQD